MPDNTAVITLTSEIYPHALELSGADCALHSPHGHTCIACVENAWLPDVGSDITPHVTIQPATEHDVGTAGTEAKCK